MPTPHNQAKKNEIAKTVLMPGDPLRAKFIAETYLEQYRLVNEVRNMYAYTGFYKGKEISIMASGMGMPSMGIYSYELYKEYDVEAIIRIGSAGSYVRELKLYDVVLAESVWSESTFARTQSGYDADILYPNKELNQIIIEKANLLSIPIRLAKVHSCDVFYTESDVDDYREIHKKHNCACIDMESFALFHNATVLNRKAACILTISDSFYSNEKTSSEERQTSFKKMIDIALNAACII